MQSVTIKSLKLTNYRQFVDQTIDFSTQKGKNIVIIEGKNGFGKSNIFNAITWCLFDVEEHLTPDERSLPVCNSKVLRNCKVNLSVKTSVKITLETEEGIKEIERIIRTFKSSGNYGHNNEKSELIVTECINKNWRTHPYPELVISRILPKEMRHFFFIDGEKLRQIFENIDPNVIKNSIFDLSQITLLQNAIEHFTYVKNKIKSGIKGDEPNIALFKNVLKGITGEINHQINELSQSKLQDIEIQNNIRLLNNRMSGIDFEGLIRLEEKRINLEKYLGELEKEIVEEKQKYFTFLYDNSLKIALKPAMKLAFDIILKLKNENRLPPKIQTTFIEELLNSGKCVCGVDLNKEENKELRDTLRRLLELESDYSKIIDKTLDLKYSLSNSLKATANFNHDSVEKQTKITNMETEYNNKQIELKVVISQIGQLDCVKARAINSEREKLKETSHENKLKIARLEEGIKTLQREYDKNDAEYKRELSKHEKYKTVTKQINLCDKSIKNLTVIKEKMMDEIRIEIQKDTKSYFDKLITEKDFSNFQITENYDLIIEQDGYNTITSLSAAETLCLGYSFMAALRENSKFLAPIVIDTPLAKIDEEYRINVANWFKESVLDAQIILLVTDTEYTVGFRSELLDVVNAEYCLKHDSKERTSEVNPYEKH